MSTDVDRNDVLRLVNQGATLVDVLPAEVYAKEHLPGAISLPLTTLDRAAAHRLDPASPVIVYCNDRQ